MASKELARPLWYVNATLIYVVYMFSTTSIHSIYPLPLQNSDLFKLKFKLSLPLASVVKYSMLCCQTIFPLSSIRGRKGPEPFLKRKKKAHEINIPGINCPSTTSSSISVCRFFHVPQSNYVLKCSPLMPSSGLNSLQHPPIPFILPSHRRPEHR